MSMNRAKFPLGQLLVTAGVDQKTKEDKGFYIFVSTSLGRYTQCDWGDTCKEDKKLNDNAVKSGDDRILAVYKYYDITIWIITERDRSATTILFPEEY